MPLIESYIEYLQYELNSSAHTVSAYISDLRQLAEFLSPGAPEDFDAATATRDDVRAWIASLGRQGEKPSSLRRKIIAVRSFYRYLRKQGVVAGNPAADIPLPRLPKPLPAFVKEEEMESLVREEDFSTDDFRTFRDKLILEMLYTTGMRCAELTELRDSDIDAERMEIRVTGKGRKQRNIPIHSHLLSHIVRYKELRDRDYPQRPDKFLLGMKGGAMNNSTLFNIVKIELASTSAPRKSPHVLRHTFATTLLRHGSEINSVKELLGHNSLSTTQIYTHLTLSELRSNYAGAHPRAGASNSPASADDSSAQPDN